MNLNSGSELTPPHLCQNLISWSSLERESLSLLLLIATTPPYSVPSFVVVLTDAEQTDKDTKKIFGSTIFSFDCLVKRSLKS